MVSLAADLKDLTQLDHPICPLQRHTAHKEEPCSVVEVPSSCPVSQEELEQVQERRLLGRTANNTAAVCGIRPARTCSRMSVRHHRLHF